MVKLFKNTLTNKFLHETWLDRKTRERIKSKIEQRLSNTQRLIHFPLSFLRAHKGDLSSEFLALIASVGLNRPVPMAIKVKCMKGDNPITYPPARNDAYRLRWKVGRIISSFAGCFCRFPSLLILMFLPQKIQAPRHKFSIRGRLVTRKRFLSLIVSSSARDMHYGTKGFSGETSPLSPYSRLSNFPLLLPAFPTWKS